MNRSLRRWSFAVFIPLLMAREGKKRVELRTVDDEVAPMVEVLRLENAGTGLKPRNEETIRLGPSDVGGVPNRLDLPSRDEVELRTHQPNIDVLIDSGEEEGVLTEEGWGASSDKQQPVPWGWFVLIGLVIAGVLTWSLVHLEQAEVQVEQIRSETESALAKEEREIREARELVERIGWSLERFFATTNVDQLARQVRQPERVLPLMRKYYLREPLHVSPLESVRVLQPVTLGNRGNFWIASVDLSDGRRLNLIIEIDPAGNALIDWETMVCDQPMPWDQYVRERPAGKSLDFRVYVERDAFFSHEFADSMRWLCFRLTALDGEEALFGYVLADSEEARQLNDILFKNGGARTSLILRLGIPERLQSRRGVVIEKVLSNRWIYVDPPETAP